MPHLSFCHSRYIIIYTIYHKCPNYKVLISSIYTPIWDMSYYTPIYTPIYHPSPMPPMRSVPHYVLLWYSMSYYAPTYTICPNSDSCAHNTIKTDKSYHTGINVFNCV